MYLPAEQALEYADMLEAIALEIRTSVGVRDRQYQIIPDPPRQFKLDNYEDAETIFFDGRRTQFTVDPPLPQARSRFVDTGGDRTAFFRMIERAFKGDPVHGGAQDAVEIVLQNGLMTVVQNMDEVYAAFSTPERP